MATKARFHRRGAGTGSTFQCGNCGRLTRNVDQASPGLCPECDELTAIENGINDGAYDRDAEGLAAAEARVAALRRRCLSKGGDAGRLGIECCKAHAEQESKAEL